MKLKFNKILVMALLVGSAILGACSDNAVVETPAILEEVDKDHVATLIAGLPKEDAKSRLAYEIETSGGIKMTWAEGDALTATPNPVDESCAYPFTLSEGQATRTGTFTCSTTVQGVLPQNYTSNVWTIYYPGSIKGDQDWFDKSYLGQKQTGNNNISHLKNYHSIRLTIDGSVTFSDTYIDFSGDNVGESKCMKFNLSNFESSKPSKIELMYMNPEGEYESCFYVYNYLSSYFNGTLPNDETTARMTLDLDGFTSNVTELTAYMMMSNYPIEVEKGGKFRVYLTTSSGKYYYDVAINQNVTLEGSHLYSVTCDDNENWKEIDLIDGFDNSTSGVEVLYTANPTITTNGADIIIMGDGFAADAFGENGSYQTVMKQAYEDFFSVEPFKSLKGYFNVYTINAVSEDNHDAEPYSDELGQNGATNRSAKTIFNTQFTPGTTSIKGNDNLALQYAMQAIRVKGGTNGAPITDENEVYRRARRALIMVMVNVEAHAGTCYKYFSGKDASDFCEMYSVAYTALNNNEFARKWTTIHEAGGHGFGKLADEYGENVKDNPTTQIWVDLNNEHALGLNRNVDRYVSSNNASDTWPKTNTDNVYWSSLVSTYKGSEGLGCYEGANTYSSLYCRPTENSVMRNQFTTNGHFFNAISRWAIWYRLKRLTGTTFTDFQSSLSGFLEFDNTLSIVKDMSADMTSVGRGAIDFSGYKPLAPSVTIELP